METKNLVLNKKPLSKGTFTKVSYELLRNDKLTPASKLVLIELLSNTENFTMNQTVLIKRTGIGEKGLRNAFKCLEENKFLKRIARKNNRGHIYIVDENGKVDELNIDNLISVVITPEPIEEPEEAIEETPEPTNNQEELITTFTNNFGDELKVAEDLIQFYNEYALPKTNFKTYKDLKTNKSDIAFNMDLRRWKERITETII